MLLTLYALRTLQMVSIIIGGLLRLALLGFLAARRVFPGAIEEETRPLAAIVSGVALPGSIRPESWNAPNV